MTHPDRFLYKAGLGAVGSYQVSGAPWVTGSGDGGLGVGVEHRIEFPAVAKSVTVINTDPNGGGSAADDLRVHFNSTGSGNVVGGNHFIPLYNQYQTVEISVKCKEIYISCPGPDSGSYVVIASLTGINTNEMFELTGSGLTD
tara:strand:- start:2 stop:430 length:429 start_codon:yes stop_codon:yes gene_type:complete